MWTWIFLAPNLNIDRAQGGDAVGVTAVDYMVIIRGRKGYRFAAWI